MTQPHTPLPWTIEYEWSQSTGDCYTIDQQRLPQETEANAAFICRAVNSHYELLAALKSVADSGEFSCFNDKLWNQVNTAIAKAEGGAG